MKIIFVGVFSPNSTNVSQARGFEENGWEVLRYDYRAKLKDMNRNQRDSDLIDFCNIIKPDYILFSKCNKMHGRVIDECKKNSKTILWYMDAMHNFDSELQTKIIKSDYFICGVEGVVPHGKKLNKKSFFVNQCPDESYNFYKESEKLYDISFIGAADNSSIHSERRNFISLLKKEFGEKFHHFEGKFRLEHNDIVNQTKINLNFSPSDRTGTSVRTFKILASGGFLLTNPWLGMEPNFIPRKHFCIFESTDELLTRINYYLDHEKEREKIAKNGLKKSKELLPKSWAKKIINLL